MKLRITGLVALAVLPLSTISPAAAGDSTAAIITLAEASADSPSSHEALARFYQQEANRERAVAKRMRDAARHRVGKLGASAWNRPLIDPGGDNDAAAARYEALATMHREQARSLADGNS